MSLVSVRSTSPRRGLVAILVENGGPAVLAVPVSAREGLLLSGRGPIHAPTWTSLVGRICAALGGTVTDVGLDVDGDATLCAHLTVVQDGGEYRVPCTPSEALVAARAQDLPVVASPAVLRLRGLDLGERELRQQLARWREELATAVVDEAAPTST